MPQIRHYMTVDLREKYYEKVKKRIFGSSYRQISNKIRKVREKFKERRKTRRIIIDSINKMSKINLDNRCFTDVMIEGKIVTRLLNTGASVSVLGNGCRELEEELNLNIQPILTNVKTASDQYHRVLGKVKVSISYKDLEHQMLLYLCPDLEQNLYLGIDFWKLFKLAPDIIGIDEMDMEKIVKDFETEKEVNKLRPHDLNEEQRMKLDKVIKEFDTFEEKGLGMTNLEKHSIKLIEGAEPVKDRYYPISPAIQEIAYKEIDTMLELNVIELSESPWSNRTTIVRKPGKNRFCLDARKLNKVTVKDAYPLQNIDGILSRIDETYYISSVDLKYAFWQIELDEESKQYTAFTVAGRPLYQFRVMPFGLCNAAQRLCRLMDKVIPSRLRDNVFVYLDDLLIISSSFEQHLHLLSEVAKYLRNANLTIGLKNLSFVFRNLNI